MLSAFLLFAGCGVPQENYDAVLDERDAAQAEVSSLESELDKVESNLERTKSDLAEAGGQIESLQSDLALAEEQLTEREAAFGQLLFFDDFEDADTEGWNLMEGWSVTQQDDNHVLKGVVQGMEHAHGNIIASYDWPDYTLETRINLFREGFWVNLRATPSLSDRYILAIFPDNLILRKAPPLSHPILAKEGLSPRLSGWNDLKVKVQGANIKVYVNEVLKIDYKDHQPLEWGGINLEIGDYSHIYLDNVIVKTVK
jgi:hypothetical protein